MRTILTLLVIVAAGVLPWGVPADEAPISGTVKAVDTMANTLTLQTTAKGKTRDVTIVLKPESKIVKFARPTEPGKTGFVEQALVLGDLKPGWVVSVTAKHEGGNEVAEPVKVVLEK